MKVIDIQIFAQTAYSQVCKFCTGELEVPTVWNQFQVLLRSVCRWLTIGKVECKAIVDTAEMDESSYKNVYPYLVEMKNMACNKYKKEYCSL